MTMSKMWRPNPWFLMFIIFLFLIITITRTNTSSGNSIQPLKSIPNKSDQGLENKYSEYEDYSGVSALSIADVTPATAERLMRLAIKKDKTAVVRTYLLLKEFNDLDRQEEKYIASFPEVDAEEAILHDLDQELEVTDPVLKKIGARKQEIIEEFRRIDSKEKKEFREIPDVAIVPNELFGPLEKLLMKIGEPFTYVNLSLSIEKMRNHPVLIIKSGALYGLRNPNLLSKFSEFSEELREYINTGGTVIVFSQPHGSNYSILPEPQEPDKAFRKVSGYGYKEDQSSFTDAASIDKWHQILSGQSRKTLTLHINGYFTNFPSFATVLLRKKANGQPVMIMYSYGQGRVIVTSIHSCFADGRQQPSSEEAALIRDLISWAKKPAKLAEMKPGEKISLSISVSNRATCVAESIRVFVYNPDRSILLSEQVVKRSLRPGSSTQVLMQYSALLAAPLGICHVDYQLYDAKSTMIQPTAETDSGRFAVSKAATLR